MLLPITPTKKLKLVMLVTGHFIMKKDKKEDGIAI